MNAARARNSAMGSASSSLLLNEATEAAAGAASTSKGKGKGKAKAVEEPQSAQEEDWDMLEDIVDPPANEVCPIIDKDINPFRLMDLPTEIRLEIYRACLTRPYNILLSKREQQPLPETDEDKSLLTMYESVSDVDETDDDSLSRVRLRAQQRSTSSRSPLANGLRGLAARGARPIRMLTSRSTSSNAGNSTSSSSSNRQSQSAGGVVFRPATSRPARRNATNSRTVSATANEPPRLQSEDPLLVNILRGSKQIYKEARSVLYSENLFTLDLNTAMPTLACLHQRSRRQIKHVEVEIPSYNEILERFQETVRLSLRYCSGLKKIVVSMPFTLPGTDGSGTTGNTTVYANGFDILRWLPQECDVIMKGNICPEIETVVKKHMLLAKTLDKVSRASLQYCYQDRFNEWIEPSMTQEAEHQ